MAQQLRLTYGIDESKPYSIEFAYGLNLVYNETDTSMLLAAEAQNIIDNMAGGGAYLPNSVNEFVSLWSYAMQGTQAAVVRHFNWVLGDDDGTNDPDGLDQVWSASAPNYGVIANAPLQNDIPNAVGGFKVRASRPFAQRLLRWGLLSQVSEDLTANAILLPNSGVVNADYFYVLRVLLNDRAPLLISGSQVQKTFRQGRVQDALYKGVSRA